MMLIHLKYLLLFTIIKKTSSDSEVQVNLPNGHITFYGEAFDTPAFHTPSRGLLYKWPTFPAPTYQMTDKFQNLWNSFPSYHTNQVTHTEKPQSFNGFNQIKSDPIQEKEVVKIYDEPIKVSKKKSLDFYDHDQPVEEEVRIPRQTGKNPKPNVKNISKLIRKALSLVKKVENIDERKKGIQDRLDKKTKLTTKFNQDNKDNQFNDLKQFIRSQNKISDLIRSETASLKNLIKDNPSIKTQPKKKDATKSMIEALVKLNSISSVLLNEKDATKAALKKIPNEIRRIVKLETEDLKKLIQSQNLDIQDQLQSQQEKQKISVEKRATSTKSEAVILKALAKLNKIAGVLLKDKQDRDQQEDTALAALPKLAKFIKAETTDIRDLLKEQAESSGDTDELKQSVSQSLANDKLIIKAIVTLNDITQNLLKDVNFTTSTVTSALPEALASLIKSETSKIRKMIDSQNSAITDIVEESKNLARAEKVIQEAKQIKETIFKQAKEPEIIEDGNDSNILQLISTLLPNQPAISKLIRPQTKELTRSEKLLQILAPLLTKNIQEVESEIENPDKNKEQQLILKTQLSGQKAIVQALTKLTNITRTLLEDKAKETRQREEEFERDRSSQNLNRRPSIRIDEEDYDRLRDDYEDDRRKPSRRRPSIDDYEDDRIKPSRRRPSRRKPSRRRPSDDDFYDYDDDDYEDEEEEQPKKSLAPAETGTNYLFEEFVKLAIERQRWDQAQAITSIIRDSNKPKRKKRPRFDDYDYEDDEYDDDEREKPRRRPGKRPSADYDDDFDERRESPRKSNKPKRKKRPKFEEYEYEEDYDYDRIKPKRRPGQRPVIEDYEIEEDRRQPPSRRKPSRRPSEEDIINLRTKAVRNNRRPTPRPRPVHLRPKSKPRPPPVEEVRSQVLIEYEYEEEYPVDEYPLEEYPIDDPVEPVTTTTTTTTTERPRRRPQQGNQQRNNRLRPAKKASQKIIDEPVQTSQQPENDVINEEPINRPESREPSRNIFGRNNFLRNKQQSTRDKISAKIRAQSQESVSKEDKPKFFAPTKRPTFTPRILEKQEENTQSVQNNINAIEKLKSLARENRPVTSKPSSNKASEETKTTNTKRKPEKKEVKSVPPKKPEPTQPPKEPKKVQPVNKNPGKLIIEEVQKIDEEKSTNKPKLFTESVRGSSESLSRQKPVPQNTPEKVVSKNKSRGRDRDRNPVDTIRIKDKNTDRPNTNKPPPRLSFAKPSRRRNENKDKTPANKPPLSSASNNLGNKNSDKLRENLLKALLGKRKDAQSRGSKDPIIKTSVSVSSSTSSSSSKEIVKANRRKKGRRKNSGSQIDTKIKNLTPQERLVKKVQETLNTRGTASNQPPRANNARPKPSAIDDAKPKRPKFGNPRTSHPKFGNPRAKPTVNNRGQPPRGRTDSPSSNRDALKKLFQISKTPTQSEREKVEERPNAEVNDVDSLVTNKLKKPKRGKLILRKKKPNASGRTGRQLFDGNSGTKKFRIKVKKLSKQEFSNFPTH